MLKFNFQGKKLMKANFIVNSLFCFVFKTLTIIKQALNLINKNYKTSQNNKKKYILILSLIKKKTVILTRK